MTKEVTVDPPISAPRARVAIERMLAVQELKCGRRHQMTRIDNVIETDGALILGAGIAGLFTALKLAPYPGPGAGRIAPRPVRLQRLGAGRHRRGGGRRR